MKAEHIQEYFWTARERFKIMIRKSQGCCRPWTEDVAFQQWRFCNVFREDDRTTVWIRNNVRIPLKHDHRVITAMAACRIINRIETLEILLGAGLLHAWDAHRALGVLKAVRPVVGGAYVVKTPDGMDKAAGVVKMITAIDDGSTDLARFICDVQTLEHAWEHLQGFPCIGSFMAYEIVSDLRHTDLLRSAPDINTWAAPGPGACRGLSWLEDGTIDSVHYGSKVDRDKAIRMMRTLLENSRSDINWPQDWPRWEIREVEHWLCEYFKWVRVHKLGDRMKRRYP